MEDFEMVYEKQHSDTEMVYGLIPKNPELFSLGILRIAIGWLWLWAFLDKLLGLGFATTPDKAWINGNSPITGFLMFGTNPESPFASFFSVELVKYAGILDFLLMGMFLFVGIGLIFGIFVRLASLAGIVFMLSIYLASIPLEHNPIVDDHIIFALILLLFFFAPTVGKFIGFGNKWQKLDIVEKYPILK
jgi:thiosulfate dehydrogenase [quinone] large subunit